MDQTTLDPPATDAIGRTLRHDGWTPARQCRFLAAIAAGHTVTDACYKVGLSPASAYALRDRAAGQAFALGWQAAAHRAREPLADQFLARAVHGQVEWRTLANGERVERFRYDNGLATRLLDRLDRQADAGGPAAQAAARLVAGEFEAFLDLIGRGEGPARAGLFVAARAEAADDLEPVRLLARADRLARTGAGLASEVATADLDVAARAGWTAEQWARAEAAGLLRVAPEPPAPAPEHQEGQLVPPPEPERVWWDDGAGEYRTSFPPPPDFDGEAEGEFGQEFYERQLTEAELVAHDPMYPTGDAALAAGEAERDNWFAARAEANGTSYAPDDAGTLDDRDSGEGDEDEEGDEDGDPDGDEDEHWEDGSREHGGERGGDPDEAACREADDPPAWRGGRAGPSAHAADDGWGGAPEPDRPARLPPPPGLRRLGRE